MTDRTGCVVVSVRNRGWKGNLRRRRIPDEMSIAGWKSVVAAMPAGQVRIPEPVQDGSKAWFFGFPICPEDFPAKQEKL